MKFNNLISHIAKAALAAVFVFIIFVAQTALAADVVSTLAQDGNEWYVNFPQSGNEATLTITAEDISAGKTTFKIYDDGGKGGSVTEGNQPGNYTSCYKGYLIIKVPTGYVIQFTGTIATFGRSHYLRMRDGATSNSAKLTRDLNSPFSKTEDIGVLLSTGNSVMMYFMADAGDATRAGFELTAKLINVNDAYNVNVASAVDGSIVSDKSTAKVHETVTLTATPNTGYMLCDVEVKDATGHIINISGNLWQDGVQNVTFKMPASAVTVTPIFRTSGNLYVNMPVDGTINRTIPTTETSIKVYDDGGSDGNYNYRANGYLLLTAPEGYRMKLSGSIKCGTNQNQGLTVYDGKSGEYPTPILMEDKHGNINDIGTVTTTDRYMLLFFCSKFQDDCSGLDLTVTLVDARQSRAVNITAATGGSITANPSSAKVHETVELNITPSTNYLLKNLTVTDENNNVIETSGGEWYSNSNTATFTMPATAVTVTPIFTNKWTATNDGLNINMPANGNINATIPSNVQSYKVKYNYSISKTGSSTLKMTAPEGYLLQLSGSVSITGNDEVHFLVYDGDGVINSSKLIESSSSENNIILVSTGNEMTINCWTVHSANGKKWNLDMTVTLISTNATNNITISNSITNGKVESDKASATTNETVTLTVTPSEGYVLESISVTDGNGAILLTPAATNATFGDAKYYATNEISFKMRSSDATVNATFMDKKDFYIKIPQTGQRDFIIPDGITSFKVYDNSGKDGYYYVNDNGKLLLTAPVGYTIKVSGYVKLYYADNGDYLDIYDGSNTSSTKLGHFWNENDNTGNQTTSVSATSSTNQMLLHFVANNRYYVDDNGGVYLTVSLLPIAYDITYHGIDGATFSTTKPTTYTVKEAITLVNPTKDDYTFLGWTYDGQTEPVETVTIPKGSTGTKEFTANWKQELGALTLYYFGNRTTAEIQGDFINTTSEDKPLVISEPKTVDKVIFKRSFTKGIPATIMLPFNFTLDASIGSFYTIESVAKNDNGEWIATPKVVTGTLQANTPYMFKAAKDLKELSFADENGITLQSTSTIEINTNGDWTLHGVYEKTMLDGDGEFNYGFAGQAVTADGISVGDFIRAGEGVWADPMRCYLTYKKGELTKAATVLPDRILVVFPDEVNSNNETTDIIENTETEDVVTPVSEFVSESVVKVWSFGGTLYIEAQPDMNYTIVDLSGRILKSGVTHSTHEEVTVNLSTGIVIVIINDKSFKLNY